MPHQAAGVVSTGSRSNNSSGRRSWARGAVLIGGLMASMALLHNAAIFSSQTNTAYEASSHAKAGNLRFQQSIDDVIDRLMRMEDFHTGNSSLQREEARGARAAASRMVDIPDGEGSRPLGSVASSGLLEDKVNREEVWMGYVIEEEPSHAGGDVGRVLGGVGGTDIPCPDRTQGPDAGACQLRCGDGGCGNVVRACKEIHGCIGYRLNREGTWATLKGRVRWVKPETPTPNYELCQRLLRSNAESISKDGRSYSWDSLWCPDFILEEHYNGISTPAYVLPDTPRSLYDRRLSTSTLTCPKPVDGILIITFQNGPSGDLCRFLSLASRFGLHVNVIGWEPKVNRRWKEFYMGSKVVTTLYMLQACSYPADTIVIFSDSDVLIQGGMEEIKQSLSRVMPSASDKRLVLATELSLEVAPNHAEKFTSLAPRHAIYKHLNSGGYAGRADTLESFLKEVGSGRAYNNPGAVRFHGSIPDLYRARLKYNSDGIPTVYHVNDQATFAEVLQQDMYHGKATMDYRIELFQSMFGRPAHQDLSIEGGKLRNHRAGTVPVFVHYNGMAKDPGHVPDHLDMKTLYRSLRDDVAPKPEGDPGSS